MFVDSSYIVALLNPRDQNHGRARQLVDQYHRLPLVTTDAVLLEVGNGLSRGFRRQAVALIRDFLSSGESHVIPLSPPLFREALALYDSYQDKEWGLVDCVSFIVMRKLGINKAFTFDRHFIQAGFSILP